MRFLLIASALKRWENFCWFSSQSACIYNGLAWAQETAAKATNKIKKRCSDLQVKNVDWVGPQPTVSFLHIMLSCVHRRRRRDPREMTTSDGKKFVSFLPASISCLVLLLRVRYFFFSAKSCSSTCGGSLEIRHHHLCVFWRLLHLFLRLTIDGMSYAWIWYMFIWNLSVKFVFLFFAHWFKA